MTIASINFQPSMERALGEAPTVKARTSAPEALALIRGHALKLARFGALPWMDAEDLAAELLERELLEARTVPGGYRRPTEARWTVIGGKHTGRPADVLAWIDRAEREAPRDHPAPMLRVDHTRAAWIQLEARSYRRRVVARRLSEATESGALPDMEAEDFTEREAEAPRPLSPAGALLEALTLCRTLEAPEQCREALAQGIYLGETEDLARAANLAPGTWRNRVSTGARIIRDLYPNPADLADVLDRNITRRRTPLAERQIGAPLPKEDRHRTPAQLAREADVLLARPQRPGRKATAAKLADGWRVEPAPAQWRPGARTVDYFLPTGALRRIAEHLAVANLPKSGARPHRAAPGLPAYGLSAHAEPAPRPGTHALATRKPRRWILRDGQITGWSNVYPEATR